jgi:hypothetical protein
VVADILLDSADYLFAYAFHQHIFRQLLLPAALPNEDQRLRGNAQLQLARGCQVFVSLLHENT